MASGATGGLHAAAMALLNPGDEVLLFEPFYGYHVATLNSMRVKPVLVPLAEPDWALDPDALHAAITPRTRAILLNTPANPSGKVFSLRRNRSRRRQSAASTTCSSSPTRSTSTSSTTAPRTSAPPRCPACASAPSSCRVSPRPSASPAGVSATSAADAKWMAAMAYFHDLTYVCAPSPFQHGAAAGLEQLPPAFYTQLAADHQSKRERIVAALRDAGMEPSVPAGAYYVLAKATPVPGATAAEKARICWPRQASPSVAGTAFFRPGRGEDLLRFCFAKKDADLDEACTRLKAFQA